MTAKALQRKLSEKQKDLDALRSDLPKIESLYEQHTKAAEEAKRAGKPFGEQAALRSKASGFESVLRQHKADITALEGEVVTLQAEYDRQTTKDKHTATWAAHDALIGDYRKETRELLCDVLERLKGLQGLKGQISTQRRDIEQLGLSLGIYQKHEVFADVRGTGFSERDLMLSNLALFDELFPELDTDRRVLELLEQLADSGALAFAGQNRHELVKEREARAAEAAQKAADRQAEAAAKIQGNENFRRALAGQGPLPG